MLLVGDVLDTAVGEELHGHERVVLLLDGVGAVEAADVGVLDGTVGDSEGKTTRRAQPERGKQEAEFHNNMSPLRLGENKAIGGIEEDEIRETLK